MQYALRNKKIILLLIIFIAFTISMITLCNNKNHPNIEKTIEKPLYKFNINIPKTSNKNLNEKIISLVNNETKVILKKTQEKKDYLKENKIKSELIFNYTKYRINNITTLIIKEKYKIDETSYNNEIYIYHYIDEEEINIDYFFKPESNYLEFISKKTYYKLLELKNEENSLILQEDETLKKEIVPNKNNYEKFYFDDEGLHIYFNEGKVAQKNMGVIDIMIPLSEIEDYINYEKIYNKKPELSQKRQIRNIDKFNDKKIIAFTFDDGPSYASTTRLLDELKVRNAKASFFILGNRLHNQQNIIKRIYYEGHTIGNHTYTHSNPDKLTEYELYSEIKKTNELIEEITKDNKIYIRPPYGIVNQNIKKISDNQIILWSIDTEDWKYKDAEIIKDNIIKNARDGAIVLLHDLYNSSIDGALLAMDELKKSGYEFVSIEELIKIKKLEDVKIIS